MQIKRRHGKKTTVICEKMAMIRRKMTEWRTGAARLTEALLAWAFPRVPVCLLADARILQEKYEMLYGSRNCEKEVKTQQMRTAGWYLSVLVVSATLIMVSFAAENISSGELSRIKRPAFGEQDKLIMAEVTVTGKQGRTRAGTVLKIRPKALGEKEKQKRLAASADSLPDQIRGHNPSLREVREDLILKSYDEEQGVQIRWTSSNPEVIDEQGAVDNIGLEEDKGRTFVNVILTAELSLEDIRLKKEYAARVFPGDGKEREADIMRARARKAEQIINQSTGGEAVVLPETLGRGTAASWKVRKARYDTKIIGMSLLVLLWIYKSRYGGLDRKIREKREAVIRDFPEFADKLILLLGAGMVASAALMKIPEDYERYRGSGLPKPLYEELLTAARRVRETNASFIEELSGLAGRLGARELLRMSAIIAENINKGSTLAEKLEAEGELLWQGRKKRAEELSRLADTKLVLPLLLLLGALVAVTITPAWLSM